MPTSRLSAVSDFASGCDRYASKVIMAAGLDYLNERGKRVCLDMRNDAGGGGWYSSAMAKPRHDWYFNQWLTHFKKTQADLVNALDWNKSKASMFASGKQRYHRDDVNDLAAYFNLEPFELLLPPERAMALRQLRASAEKIVTLASDNPKTGDTPTDNNRDQRRVS